MRQKFWSFGVTAHPTAEWIANQLTQACGWDQIPRYLIRDRDGAYGEIFVRRVRSIGIRDRPTSPRSPWQNAFAERLIGSIRRECIDHIVVFGERHLRHVLLSYMSYYNGTRTHLSLNNDGAEITRRRDSGTHSLSSDSGRIASSICSDLICGRHRPLYSIWKARCGRHSCRDDGKNRPGQRAQALRADCPTKRWSSCAASSPWKPFRSPVVFGERHLSRTAVVHDLLQRRAKSPVIEQGCTCTTRRRDSRAYYLPTNPGRTASSIYPDLICDKDRRSRATFLSSLMPHRTCTTLNGRPCWLRLSIRSTAWDSRLMKDAVTTVIVHFSRQQGQSLLNVDQDLCLVHNHPDRSQRMISPHPRLHST